MMKKILRLSPFILISVGLIVYGIILLLFHSESSDGWEKVFFLFLSIIAVVVFVVDVLMKLLIKKSKIIIIIQLLIISIVAISYFSKKIEQKVVLPANFSEPYVTIIFDVEGENPIPNRYSLMNKSIFFKDGYLLTSSGHKQYRHDHFILTYANGQKLNPLETDYGFSRLPVSHFNYNGKTHYYLTFKIQPKKECCGYGGRELEQNKQRIIATFSELKKNKK